MRCLTGARFNMSATLLHQNEEAPTDIDLGDYGEWTDTQDPLTGEIIKRWIPYENPTTDPTRPEVRVYNKIPVLARGIVDGGIRVAGTTEWFNTSEYRNIDFVKLWLPAKYFISKRDRVTNISDPKGNIVWRDEEFDDPTDDRPAQATVFNVNGVTPLFDAFNRHVENYVMLERAEVA